MGGVLQLSPHLILIPRMLLLPILQIRKLRPREEKSLFKVPKPGSGTARTKSRSITFHSPFDWAMQHLGF